MALSTNRLILTAFQEMLVEMPFDRITVSALVRRAGVSSNTFYYHYRDIYELLDVWFRARLGEYLPGNSAGNWRDAARAVLVFFKSESQAIYHVFNALSRDRLERYVYGLTEPAFLTLVRRAAGEREIPEQRLREIAVFCSCAYVGFMTRFLWDRMAPDPEESMERLGRLFDSFVAAALEDTQPGALLREESGP